MSESKIKWLIRKVDMRRGGRSVGSIVSLEQRAAHRGLKDRRGNASSWYC